MLDEPPPELVAFRRQWRLDYGKIDYVVHDGAVVILDVNRTPTSRRNERIESMARELAGAIGECAG